jgi:nucleotide-binding universal stress UspA family protein
MFWKILLAYDGSAFGAAALRQSADLARLCKAELHLLGIVLTTSYRALAEGLGATDILGKERESLQQALDAAVRGLDAQGVNVISTIREGDPQAEIINYAHRINADLVLGHSGKGTIARWFEGSVGSELLTNLPCSLLIAKGEA